ncbi:MAG: hypothetical protein ACTSYN_03770 [Candidatus Heimdallarchaeaceae archaeon]
MNPELSAANPLLPFLKLSPPPRVKCGTCNGSGESRHHYYCKICGGIGVMTVYGKYEIRPQNRKTMVNNFLRLTPDKRLR